MRIIDANALLDCLDADQPYNWTDSDAEIQATVDWDCFRSMIATAPTVERSYIDLLVQLYNDVQSDECMRSCGKISILNKITQLEQALEKYSG